MTKDHSSELIKISELAKAAGTTVSTIHYYIKEGLLTPPTKTARNMAYYNRKSIEEIRQVQELQVKRYLPLSSIKLILNARREGQSPDHIAEMQHVFEDMFQPIENMPVKKELSLAGLAGEIGLPESALKDLEERGLIVPTQSAQGPRYNDIDFCVARIFKKLSDYGVKIEDLEIYRRYIYLIRMEAQEMHNLVHRLPNHDQLPLVELLKNLNELKRYLEMRIYRQEMLRDHSPNSH